MSVEPEGYWDDPNTRRDFLLAIAKRYNFDPLLLHNWRMKEAIIRAQGVNISLSRSLLLTFAKGTRLLEKYKNLKHLLLDSFPELQQPSPGKYIH